MKGIVAWLYHVILAVVLCVVILMLYVAVKAGFLDGAIVALNNALTLPF